MPRHFLLLAILFCSLIGNTLWAAAPAIDSSSPPAVLQISAAEEARAGALLTETQHIALNAVSDLWRRNPASTQADLQWEAFMADLSPPLGPRDQRLLLRWALRNAYIEGHREILFHSDRADAFEEARDRFLIEARRARNWIETHRASGAETIDPPFLPDTRLERPDPIRGPKPSATDRALTTLQAVNRYAMGIQRQYAQMGDDAQLARLAAQRAGARQRHLQNQAAAIMVRLISDGR
ncbi:MAG: hypothetical protein DWQ09_09950 [Proteobacteria bacterium]|nr:MAG: hypothetical protein DWQ09_09950 [Pseudomonadota bacterium]QKK10559.1 MAG: hypothetical protein HND59_01995 [Pseudomonadota bacterium]